jgi:hypothetical protein
VNKLEEESKEVKIDVICQKCGYWAKAGEDVYSTPSKCPMCNHKFQYEKLKRRHLECDACDSTAEVLIEDEDDLPSAERCPNGHFWHWENYDFDGEFNDHRRYLENEDLKERNRRKKSGDSAPAPTNQKRLI